MNNSGKPKFPPNQLLSEGAVNMTTTAVSKTNPFRILSDGHKYKIQKLYVESSFFIFGKNKWNETYVWKNLGCYEGGVVITKYYDTLEKAKLDYDLFVEYDKKLTDWTEVKV